MIGRGEEGKEVLFAGLQVGIEKFAPLFLAPGAVARRIDEDELARFFANTVEIEFTGSALSSH